MLEKLLKLYYMAIAADVRSPMPHLFGPPGCGKSSVAYQLAEIVDRKLHILNVSRLSPLEVEGVQMPHGEGMEMRLRMLLSTFWNSLSEGDIVLLDEFLRGFPEVYNALLDILTSREVAGHVLPKVFILGASNSTVSYDKALEDRLLHLPVPDPRHLKRERTAIAKRMVDELGLHPKMVQSIEMQSLLDNEILPMYDILDNIGKGNGGSAPSSKGHSLRNLIGQAKLREIQSTYLAELLSANNNLAMGEAKFQFVFITDGKKAHPDYAKKARQLVGNERLTPIMAENLSLNLQLIEMESARNEKGTDDDDVDTFVSDDELLNN